MTLRHSLFDKIFISFWLFLRFVLDLSSSMPPTSHEACLSMTEQKYWQMKHFNRGSDSRRICAGRLHQRWIARKSTLLQWQTECQHLGYRWKGIIYGFANADGHPDNPKNIFLVDPDFDIYTAQSFNGKFYNTFKSNVISVAIPIHINNQPNGMLLIHSTVEQLQNIQEKS